MDATTLRPFTGAAASGVVLPWVRVTQFVLYGRVAPEPRAGELSYSGAFSSNLGAGIGWLEGRVILKGAKASIRIVTPDGFPPEALANNVRSEVATILDAHAFVTGSPRTLELTSGRNLETGEDLEWTGRVPEVAGFGAREALSVDDLLLASGRSILLSNALADFRRAMTEPWDAGFYAYRSCETVARHWRGSAEQVGSRAWEAMRSRLKIELDEMNAVKSWADPQRHGARSTIGAQEHVALLATAHRVLAGFASLLMKED